MSLYEYTLDAYKHSGEIRIPSEHLEDSNTKKGSDLSTSTDNDK
jgi:hypothetical protein